MELKDRIKEKYQKVWVSRFGEPYNPKWTLSEQEEWIIDLTIHERDKEWLAKIQTQIAELESNIEKVKYPTFDGEYIREEQRVIKLLIGLTV